MQDADVTHKLQANNCLSTLCTRDFQTNNQFSCYALNFLVYIRMRNWAVRSYAMFFSSRIENFICKIIGFLIPYAFVVTCHLNYFRKIHDLLILRAFELDQHFSRKNSALYFQAWVQLWIACVCYTSIYDWFSLFE